MPISEVSVSHNVPVIMIHYEIFYFRCLERLMVKDCFELTAHHIIMFNITIFAFITDVRQDNKHQAEVFSSALEKFAGRPTKSLKKVYIVDLEEEFISLLGKEMLASIPRIEEQIRLLSVRKTIKTQSVHTNMLYFLLLTLVL